MAFTYGFDGENLLHQDIKIKINYNREKLTKHKLVIKRDKQDMNMMPLEILMRNS